MATGAPVAWPMARRQRRTVPSSQPATISPSVVTARARTGAGHEGAPRGMSSARFQLRTLRSWAAVSSPWRAAARNGTACWPRFPAHSPRRERPRPADPPGAPSLHRPAPWHGHAAVPAGETPPGIPGPCPCACCTRRSAWPPCVHRVRRVCGPVQGHPLPRVGLIGLGVPRHIRAVRDRLGDKLVNRPAQRLGQGCGLHGRTLKGPRPRTPESRPLDHLDGPGSVPARAEKERVGKAPVPATLPRLVHRGTAGPPDGCSASATEGTLEQLCAEFLAADVQVLARFEAEQRIDALESFVTILFGVPGSGSGFVPFGGAAPGR